MQKRWRIQVKGNGHCDIQLRYRAGVIFPEPSPRAIQAIGPVSPGAGAARRSRASLQLVLLKLGQFMHRKVALTRFWPANRTVKIMREERLLAMILQTRMRYQERRDTVERHVRLCNIQVQQESHRIKCIGACDAPPRALRFKS